MLLSSIERQQFLTSIIDELDIMIWIKDSSNNLLYLNKSSMRNIFNCNKRSNVNVKECPLKGNLASIVKEEVHLIEEVVIRDKKMFLKCRKIPLDGGNMLVLAEDITESMIERKKDVSLLNKKLETWSMKNDIRSKKSNKKINDILKGIQELKLEKNI